MRKHISDAVLTRNNILKIHQNCFFYTITIKYVSQGLSVYTKIEEGSLKEKGWEPLMQMELD